MFRNELIMYLSWVVGIVIAWGLVVLALNPIIFMIQKTIHWALLVLALTGYGPAVVHQLRYNYVAHHRIAYGS